jgi:hypothetical protein
MTRGAMMVMLVVMLMTVMMMMMMMMRVYAMMKNVGKCAVWNGHAEKYGGDENERSNDAELVHDLDPCFNDGLSNRGSNGKSQCNG